MASANKLEMEIDINSPADKFYNILKAETHQMPRIAPSTFHHVEVHEGDWESHGSLKQWKYTVDGKVETFKDRVELDEPNKSVSFVGLEGDIMNDYESFRATLKATPKAETEACSVKITIEYEKKNENVDPPTKYLDFLVNAAKDIDAHLLKPSPNA